MKRFIHRIGLTGLALLAGLRLVEAAIAVNVTPSRTAGVAPLAVFFDATATTGLADNDYLNATFAWNFDADDNDPNGHYEKASGFVCGHVFDQPGTYRVHLDVYDKSGQTAGQDITVNVTAFSGTTYYVAADGSDSNNGTSMSTPLLTVQHALVDMAKPNTRILFRNGDTFNTPNSGIFISGKNGPVIIGSYNDPNHASAQVPVLYCPSVNSTYWTLDLENDDWRIMDIAIRAGGHTGNSPRYPGGLYLSKTNNLCYRVQFSELAEAIGLYGLHNTIAECDMYSFAGDGIYSDNMKAGDDIGAVIIGNRMHDSPDNDDLAHMYRLQGGSLAFIGFNEFGPNVIPLYDDVTIRGNTTKVVLYKNKIWDWVTSVRPMNQNSSVEYQDHVVLDSNLFIGVNNRDRAIEIDSTYIVIRNNIFYNYLQAISIIEDAVVGPSHNVYVYNNTMINNIQNSSFDFAHYNSPCTNLTFYNNLMLDSTGANGNNNRFVQGGAASIQGSDYNRFWGSNWTASLALYNGQNITTWRSVTGFDQNSVVQQNPLLLSTDFNNANFAVPQPASPLINAGTPMGAKLDYYGNLRDSLIDIGAVEAVSLIPPDATPPARPKGFRFQ